MTELPTPDAVMTDAPRHVFPVRVYYEDTDAGGIVYHANYLRFAERGRTEWLRQSGVDHTELRRDGGLVFTVKRCDVEFVKPAVLDDALQVVTTFLAVRGASFDLRQTVERDGEVLADLGVKIACVDVSGRPARLPGDLRRGLAALVAGPAQS